LAGEEARRTYSLTNVPGEWPLRIVARVHEQVDERLLQLRGVGGQRRQVVFDVEADVQITRDNLHTRHLISPYIGEQLQGKVIATYVRGKAVFENTKFNKELLGIEI